MELAKNRITEYIKSNIRLGLAYLLCSVALYSGYVTNILPNPDAIWNSTIYKGDIMWNVQCGRYMISFWQYAFGCVIPTEFLTIISLSVISLVCVILVRFFDVRGMLWQFIAGMVIITAPCIQSGLTYYYTYTYYAIAEFLMTVAAVMVIKSFDKSFKSKVTVAIVSVLMVCVSLATYQAYLSVFLVIGVIYLMRYALSEESSWRSIVYRTAHYLVVFGGGLILYLITNKLVMAVLDVDSSQERFQIMGNIDVRQIGQGLIGCYYWLLNYLLGDRLLNNSFRVMGLVPRRVIAVLALAVLVISGILLLVRNNKALSYKVFSIICAAVFLPISLMALLIVSGSQILLGETGCLVYVEVNMIYFITVMCLSELLSENDRLLRSIGAVSLIMVIIMYAQMGLTGQVYLRYRMNMMGTVADRIYDELAEYLSVSDASKVCIIGRMEDGGYPDQYLYLRDSVKWTSASYGTVWDEPTGAMNCWRQYMQDFMGVTYDVCSAEEYNEIASSDSFKDMNIFPSEGSVKTIDGIVVVKLSDRN